MPRRNENAGQEQQNQGQRGRESSGSRQSGQSGQSGRESIGSRRTAEIGDESRGDRERGLQTSREPQSRGGMVQQRQHAPGIAVGHVVTPFSLVSRMLEDMDRMLEGSGGSRELGGSFGGQLSPLRSGLGGNLARGFGESLWSPAIEMFQRKDKLVIRADLPGVSRDDLDIEIADDALIIQGERRHEEEEEQEDYYRSERYYGQFFRIIPLPEGIDGDKADAKFKDGTLEITLPAPKREDKRSRKLSIK
jgi:HSP20 family protein